MSNYKDEMTDKEADDLLHELVEFAESEDVAEKYKNLKTPIFIDSNEPLELPLFISRELKKNRKSFPSP